MFLNRMKSLGNWHPNLRRKDPDQGAESIIKVSMNAEVTDKRI